MKRALVISLGTLLAATAAHATTYVRVEKDGSKTYSDRPLPGGQPIDIQPAQTYSAPASSSPADPSLSPEQRNVLDAANFHYACAISPQADQTFHNPESVTIAVQLTPALRPGDEVKFSLDGAQLANEANSTAVTLEFPDRGSHTAGVEVTDGSGRVVCNTSATFHVLRTGLNSPARRPATTPRPRPPSSRPPRG